MLSGQGRVGRGCQWLRSQGSAASPHLYEAGPAGPVLSIPPLLTGLFAGPRANIQVRESRGLERSQKALG